MSLESGTYIQDLQQTNPPGTDKKKQGDDHLRLIKTVLKNTFPDSTKTFYFPGGSTKTTTYVIATSDQNKLIVCDATSAGFTVTLPTLAAGDAGWLVGVVKSDASANAVTVGGTINGGSNYVILSRYRHVVFQWSGSAWFAFSSFSSQAPITTAELGDLSVSTAKLIDASVTTAKHALLSVTSGVLADNSVSTAKVVDGAVTPAKRSGTVMTKQILTSGTAATYTTPANCHTICIKMIGGGGGGGAANTNNGNPGGTTIFNGINANGGSGGNSSSSKIGGLGGTGGTGSATLRTEGNDGGPSSNNCYGGGSASAPPLTGTGGAGLHGGAGRGGVAGAGGAGKNNSGAGGGGGGDTTSAGSGGGSGEYVEIIIQAPASTYVYTVGVGGTGGAAGGQAGANGGSGIIIVEEYY